MKVIGVVVAIFLISVGAVVAFAYSGVFEIAATTSDARVVQWVLETTRENSVRKGAEQIVVAELSGEDRLPRGAKAFDEMCANCHGAPGRDPFLGARYMNPSPPDLADAARDSPPQELFWVTKNGLRMTGMPAWGPTHGDDQLWDLVALMKRLPELTPDGYSALVEAPGNDGHDHEHGTHAPADTKATAVDAPNSTGSAVSTGYSHDTTNGHAH